jgi:protein O-mannosyl-transferase
MIGQQSALKAPVGADRRGQRWRVAGLCVVLAAITFAVFGQTLQHEFVNYDDGDFVYENPVVTQGLTLKGIVWVFTHRTFAIYHPLTMFSLMADHQLYGLHAGGYHFTNVLLHTASVILLFLILRQMTGALWRSAFVAAVFAIHPLRVESVAWVAERKDVLSAFFFMLTLGAYVRYVRKPDSPGRYLVVAAAFVLALLSKPTVLTLPFVLLLLDYWPLRRFEQPRKLSRLILEKIPLLALAAGACAVAVLVSEHLIIPEGNFSIPARLGNALVYYAIYLRQMVWPAGLAVPYLSPHNGVQPWEMALAGALLAGLSAVAWGERRRRPWLLMGWLWYLGMLTPMIGIKPVGAFARADRYTYLPQIGIYVALTWLVAEWRMSRVALGSLMAGVLAVLMVCAWKQTAYWQNSETLWTHTLACTTDNYIAHNNLGGDLLGQGRVDEAINHFLNALQLKPDFAKAHYNLGLAFFRKGRVDEAIAQYQEALHINSSYADEHRNRGLALARKGRLDEAITQYQQEQQINPDLAEVHYNLGNALLQQGKVDEAITQYQQALEINPDCAEAHYNLGVALFQTGKVDEAITHFQVTLQINPDYADGHRNLGLALARKGRTDEAITQYQQALKTRPDHAEAHYNLGNALLQKGRTEEAISQYQEALQIKPTDSTIQNSLAWLLATCPQASLRNGNKAVELAERANELTGGENTIILHTLAAALAEAGQFTEAIKTAQHALQLAKAQSNTRLARQLQIEMKLYQAGNPFHTP